MKNNTQKGAAPIPELSDLGWTQEHQEAFGKYTGPYIPGRVSCRQKTVWDVITGAGQVQAGISGALKKLGRFPVVGDFVVLLSQPEAGACMIVDILPRKTLLTRGAVGGEGSDQAIAANVDTVFIVTAAGQDMSARRIERYLALAHAAGARPVVVINKADLAEDTSALAGDLLPASSTIPVVVISARTGSGVQELDACLSPGTTAVLVGSSGVGKSTLMNRLLGESIQETSGVRDSDGKGRHTTTVRQLFILPNRAILIDNPGIREVGVGTAAEGISLAFPDILELAQGCRFSDCSHEQEPGCAVRDAVSSGTLSVSRLENYHRLRRELAFEQERAEIGLVRSERKRWKGISKMAKEIGKKKER